MIGALVIFLIAPGLLLIVATVVYLVVGRARPDDERDANAD